LRCGRGGTCCHCSGVPLAPSATRNNYFRASRQSRTDADGRFEFSKLAPGDYVIGLTLHKKRNAASADAIWFEPSAPGQLQSIAIVAGQRLHVGDVRLPASATLALVSQPSSMP
jgi:hypothetical protein